jgi:hypothetical protein
MKKLAKCNSIGAGAALLLLVSVGNAQQVEPAQKFSMQPRAIADSTFAAALAVNDLANEIRHGTLSPRTHNDPALRLAVEQLAVASAARKRPDFLRNVPLWDFTFDSLAFAAGPNERHLIVTARARFAHDSGDAHRVTFHLRRKGTEWTIVDHDGLHEYLVAKHTRAKGGALTK